MSKKIKRNHLLINGYHEGVGTEYERRKKEDISGHETFQDYII